MLNSIRCYRKAKEDKNEKILYLLMRLLTFLKERCFRALGIVEVKWEPQWHHG